ncbi:hypothetical protein NC651_024406 [Populus alba x Populus x berolinensis]|nr:hypothetical protein NC651_024406 [Populus alba x Populus x berolinensis]
MRWALHSVTVHVLVLCCGGSKPRTVLQFASGFAAGQKTPARVYMEKLNFFSCSAEIKLPDFSCALYLIFTIILFSLS